MEVKEEKEIININAIKLPETSPPEKKKRGRPAKSKETIQKPEANDSEDEKPKYNLQTPKTDKESKMDEMKKELKHYFLKHPSLQSETANAPTINIQEINNMSYDELEQRLMLVKFSFSKKFDTNITKNIVSSIGASLDMVFSSDDHIKKSMSRDKLLEDSIGELSSPLFATLNPTFRVALLSGFHIIEGISKKWLEAKPEPLEATPEVEVVEEDKNPLLENHNI